VTSPDDATDQPEVNDTDAAQTLAEAADLPEGAVGGTPVSATDEPGSDDEVLAEVEVDVESDGAETDGAETDGAETDDAETDVFGDAAPAPVFAQIDRPIQTVGRRKEAIVRVRLVSGTGRIELNDEMDGELSFRVTDTSLDPYLRVLQPTFSPFTSAITSGTIRVVGELYNPEALRIDTNIEEVNLRMLDYRLRNQSPIRLSVEHQVLQVDSLKMVGEDTELDLSGSVNLVEEPALKGPFMGVKELGTKLAASEQARDCVATQWFRYATGRTEEVPDGCSLTNLQDAFGTSGGDLSELVVAMTQTDAFWYRAPYSQ